MTVFKVVVKVHFSNLSYVSEVMFMVELKKVRKKQFGVRVNKYGATLSIHGLYLNRKLSDLLIERKWKYVEVFLACEKNKLTIVLKKTDNKYEGFKLSVSGKRYPTIAVKSTELMNLLTKDYRVTTNKITIRDDEIEMIFESD